MFFRILTLLLLVLFLSPTTHAQQRYFGLTKMQVKRLSTVSLINGEKEFPESYLYGMHGDSLILLTDISAWEENSIFAKSKISIAGYEELTISSRAERRRKSVLWGSIIGAASYAIAQRATQDNFLERSVGKTLLGQRPFQGYIVGTIAGITGFGAGMVIGQVLAKRKISLKKQKRKALKQLKEFSYR